MLPTAALPTVSSDLVGILLSGASLPAATTARLLAASGIDPDVLQGAHRRVAADRFAMLWAQLQATSDDPHFGLRLGRLGDRFPGGHVLFASMMNSATVGDALRRYCRYHGIMADVVRPELRRQGDRAVLAVRTFHPLVRLHRQQVECIASVMVAVIRRLVDGPFVGGVRFAHASPGDLAPYREVLGPDVRFEQTEDAVVIPAAALKLPIRAADPELVALLDRHARRVLARDCGAGPWTTEVTRKLADLVGDGRPALGDVAATLGVSARTLQARLRREDTSFQGVLTALRRDLAVAHLVDADTELAEIAFLLGYAEQSAFQRAFRRWTGESPKRYRQRCRRGPRGASTA